MNWQRWARLLVAVGAVAFAVVVALGVKRRVPAAAARVASTDSKAVVESASGLRFGWTVEHEDTRIEYQRLLTYTDGSTKMQGVTVVTEREGGRQFTITAKEGDVSKDESDISLTGDVKIAVSDGMLIHTERASYKKADGDVRAPGPVELSRGRMTGSSNGFTYDKGRDQITLIDRVSLHVAADPHGGGAMDISAPSATFNRTDKTIHFEAGLHATRKPQVIEAESAVAHLSADEDRLEAIELRGNSRITGAADGGVGGLRSLTGRDVDLKYGPDGQVIEHALVVGNALIQFAGEGGHEGRRIAGNTVDLTLAPDGSTPVALGASGDVQLVFPPEPGGAARTINAQQLHGRGDAQHGLTSAHFEGAVRYREQAPNVDRHAVSQVLDTALGSGMSSIDDATFTGAVQFDDASMTAVAAVARYVLDKGTLDLSAAGAGGTSPRVDTERIGIDAPKISVTLDGPLVKASGSVQGPVKSLLKHQAPGAGGEAATKAAGTKMPSMLKQDQDVLVTAGNLDYDGTRSNAAYTGDVRLIQGDTSIKAATLAIDDKSGDLAASGSNDEAVATSMVHEEAGKDNKTERIRSDAKAKDFKYDDAARRLTYTGDAHMVGPAGDLTAGKIEVYLNESGDEIERVESYDAVTLRETTGRQTTGKRLTYTSPNEQYVVVGTPVHVVEACGRETTGERLTLYKTTDRIAADGSDPMRTQTTGGNASCP